MPCFRVSMAATTLSFSASSCASVGTGQWRVALAGERGEVAALEIVFHRLRQLLAGSLVAKGRLGNEAD